MLNSNAGNTLSQFTQREEVGNRELMQRWEQRQISEELSASSLTHALLITSHWVAGQERGGEMVMSEGRRRVREAI